VISKALFHGKGLCDAIRDALKCGGEAPGILLVSPMIDRLMVNAASNQKK